MHITVPLKAEEAITEGDSCVLHAEVSKPDVTGTWFKDELEIIPKVDKKYDAAVSGTVHELTIRDASADDQAEYTLEIGDDSTTAVLKVQGNVTVLITTKIFVRQNMMAEKQKRKQELNSILTNVS